ncbi:MAG TPA: PDZ domain-containing protein [Vicinamibacterales bacterium]|nr:PDZ domain-containing protein [Vicinamibacterales bacterium]
MTRRVRFSIAVIVVFAAGFPGGPLAQGSAVDAAFATFWSASSPEEASRLVEPIVRARPTFDEAYRRLAQGRPYPARDTGVVRMENRTSDGVEHFFAVDVPDSYDPARRYQVRIQLHGGVGGRATNAPVGNGTVGALVGAEQIYVVPNAWAASPWWGTDQVRNLAAIVDRVKRLYNVDENRVVLSGVSDGATGALYVAMRETTPFASILPLNGYIMVLALPDIDDGLIFANNLRNKPLFAVNGGRDPLYPTRVVDPYIQHLKQGGVSIDYRPQPNAGHNTAWWPEVKDGYEAFVRDHPRRPLPDTLSWETGSGARFDRAHWLVIDRLGPQKNDARAMPDLNDMPMPPSADFGARSVGMRINRVVDGSNAAQIGLKAGDVLLRLNDRSVAAAADVADALSDEPPGSKLVLLVVRDNAPVELEGVYRPQIVETPPKHLFARGGASGRVDLARAGNAITATTRGVAAFTLLLSPDQFDFGKPVKVIANGKTMFDGKVEKNLRTLLKYAAADNDRTMLFGAELHVDLAR